MNRYLQLEVDDKHKLSIAQNIEGDEVYHEIALMKYVDHERSYHIVEVIQVYDIQELFDLICEAYSGDFSIWYNQYEVLLESDVDNDNQPMLNLVVDNDWPEDRADD